MLPVIGLGTWQTFDVGAGDHAARAMVLQRFLELGGRLVDTSPMYGKAESVVGQLASELDAHAQLFMATKVWTTGRADGRGQMDESFRRLRVGQMDLMQVHNLVDVETHLDTLAQWKAEGRIRYFGVTHYTVASHALLEPFVRRRDIDFVQCNYSLAVRDAERRLLPTAAEHSVAIIINRPFENGDIFRRCGTKPLPGVALDLGCTTWAQLFLKYVIAHPAVTCVIPATRKVEHLEANMRAGTEPLPTEAMRQEIVRAWEG
jgi:aryl-alcohol dehydrogenase-like predicted oxidoreductase